MQNMKYIVNSRYVDGSDTVLVRFILFINKIKSIPKLVGLISFFNKIKSIPLLQDWFHSLIKLNQSSSQDKIETILFFIGMGLATGTRGQFITSTIETKSAKSWLQRLIAADYLRLLLWAKKQLQTSERKMKRYVINVEIGSLDFKAVFIADDIPALNLLLHKFDESVRPHYRTEPEEITDLNL